MRKADIITGIFLMVLAAGVMIEAGTYAHRGVQIEYFGPAFFPRILAIALILCAGLLVINALRKQALRRVEFIDRRGLGRLALAIAVGIVYWLAIDYTGFLIGSPIFLFVLMTVLGARSWLQRIATSLAAPLALWAIFEYFLVISLPESQVLYLLFGES
ncbi:MAG: tripartite tricarboxylate transporter TctB family protein [Rhodospirillales bacterium]|nr:tripartite tricarboxylate transporter TctB family protein [Rhodospirillales bacterium]